MSQLIGSDGFSRRSRFRRSRARVLRAVIRFSRRSATSAWAAATSVSASVPMLIRSWASDICCSARRRESV